MAVEQHGSGAVDVAAPGGRSGAGADANAATGDRRRGRSGPAVSGTIVADTCGTTGGLDNTTTTTVGDGVIDTVTDTATNALNLLNSIAYTGGTERTAQAVFNAANEVAVQAFLDGAPDGGGGRVAERCHRHGHAGADVLGGLGNWVAN